MAALLPVLEAFHMVLRGVVILGLGGAICGIGGGYLGTGGCYLLYVGWGVVVFTKHN